MNLRNPALLILAVMALALAGGSPQATAMPRHQAKYRFHKPKSVGRVPHHAGEPSASATRPRQFFVRTKPASTPSTLASSLKPETYLRLDGKLDPSKATELGLDMDDLRQQATSATKKLGSVNIAFAATQAKNLDLIPVTTANRPRVEAVRGKLAKIKALETEHKLFMATDLADAQDLKLSYAGQAVATAIDGLLASTAIRANIMGQLNRLGSQLRPAIAEAAHHFETLRVVARRGTARVDALQALQQEVRAELGALLMD